MITLHSTVTLEQKLFAKVPGTQPNEPQLAGWIFPESLGKEQKHILDHRPTGKDTAGIGEQGALFLESLEAHLRVLWIFWKPPMSLNLKK